MSARIPGQLLWPAQEERNATRAFEEILLLPAMMIPQKISVIGEKADQRILGRPASISVENPSQTRIDV